MAEGPPQDGQEGQLGSGPEVVDAEVLPVGKRKLAKGRGRVFDASGHVEHDPDRWRPFARERGRARPSAGVQGGCAPRLARTVAGALGALALGALVLAALAGAGWSGAETTALLRDAGVAGRVGLVLVVAALTPFFVPSGLMAVVPGYLWGAVEGTALILAGAALGGLLNMWLARRVVGARVEALVQAAPLLAALRETIRLRGFRIALALRMSPVTPYSMLAYLAGLAGLSYGRFTVASVVGGVPWTSVYAMAGALLAETAQDLTLGEAPALGPEAVWLRWAGLAFTVVVAVWIGRAAKADLARMRDDVGPRSEG